MKAFTDLEQSKKLAEFLHFETADMCYPLPCKDEDKPLLEQGGFGSTPCWSLSALLNVLPRIDIEKEIWTDDTFDYRVKAYIGDGYAGDWFDNPVDACVNMVIKLHEQKLL